MRLAINCAISFFGTELAIGILAFMALTGRPRTINS
ncbi:Uncharacterised protein [Vibrio cholerae]|nr:Uncharacterised protein [Vibrio cholerae]